MVKKVLLTALLLAVSVLLVTGCGKGGGSKAKFKIGVVFDVGGKGDKSFNDSAYAGMLQIATNYKGFITADKISYGKDIELKYLEPKQGGQDREQLLRVLAEDNYNLIYGIGFAFSDSIAKVAKDFPKTHFVIIDGYIPNLNEAANITCISFAENEGSFLVGAIAGLTVKKGKLGFLGGMDIPLIHKFQGGFMAGAMYVNKDMRKPGMILAQYIGKDPSAFADAPAGHNIAASMYKNGAEIIFHAAGGSGAGLFQAAQEAKKLAIGVDSDQGLIYSSDKDAAAQDKGKYILTSMLKRVDNSVFMTGKEFIEKGKLAGGYLTFGLKEDGVNYAVNDFNKDKLAGVTAKIDELKAKIISGEIVVPDSDAKVADFVKGLK